MWLIQYNRWWLASSEVLRGFVIISSQVFGHLRSFKGWIQTEACVIPSYHGMLLHLATLKLPSATTKALKLQWFLYIFCLNITVEKYHDLYLLQSSSKVFLL